MLSFTEQTSGEGEGKISTCNVSERACSAHKRLTVTTMPKAGSFMRPHSHSAASIAVQSTNPFCCPRLYQCAADLPHLWENVYLW